MLNWKFSTGTHRIRETKLHNMFSAYLSHRHFLDKIFVRAKRLLLTSSKILEEILVHQKSRISVFEYLDTMEK